MMRRCRFNCKLLTANILSLASHYHDLQNKKLFSMTSEIVSEPINSSGMCLYSHKTKIAFFPKSYIRLAVSLHPQLLPSSGLQIKCKLSHLPHFPHQKLRLSFILTLAETSAAYDGATFNFAFNFHH